MKHLLIYQLLAYVTLTVSQCGSCGGREWDPEPQSSFRITAFRDNDSIPYKFTCSNFKQVSPQMSWDFITNKTKSYVLIMDDPDAVQVVGYTWNHWLLYDIPPGSNVIQEGKNKYGPLPAGVLKGLNSFGDTAYGGPCPPKGQKHTYVFTVYDLDLPSLGLPAGANSAAVRNAMKGHIIDSLVYRGTFTGK